MRSQQSLCIEGEGGRDFSVPPRNLRPMRPSSRYEPFDSDQFIYKLKVDGFRALAHTIDVDDQRSAPAELPKTDLSRSTTGAASSSRAAENLERQLQPELHHAVASRSDERISGRDVGRGAPTTEPSWA